MKAFTDIFQYQNGDAFPHTKAVSSTTADSFDGTEYNKPLIDEIMGLFQAIILKAGKTPNGITDTAQSCQLLENLGIINSTIRQGRFDVWPTISAKSGYVDCTIKEHICNASGPITTPRKYTEISFMRSSSSNDCSALITKMGSTNPYSRFVTYLSWDTSCGESPLVGSAVQEFATIPAIAYRTDNYETHSGFISFNHNTTISLGGVPTRCIAVMFGLFQGLDISVIPTNVVLKNCNLSFNNV